MKVPQEFNMMNYFTDGFLYALDRAYIIPVHLVRMKNFTIYVLLYTL